MIRLVNLSKGFDVNGQRKLVIDNLNLTLATGKSQPLLGRNGAGKSTLLQIIAGNTRAVTGRVVRDGTISWPIGLAGAVHPNLSGAQNARFIARVYGVDTEELVDFVQDFAQLGAHFFMEVRTYSAGMRARLNFGLSMGIKFDTYLIDEVTGAGDAAFRARSVALFHERMATSDAIMVNHNLGELKEFCDAALLLEHGKLTYFEDLDEAIEAHRQNMA